MKPEGIHPVYVKVYKRRFMDRKIKDLPTIGPSDWILIKEALPKKISFANLEGAFNPLNTKSMDEYLGPTGAMGPSCCVGTSGDPGEIGPAGLVDPCRKCGKNEAYQDGLCPVCWFGVVGGKLELEKKPVCRWCKGTKKYVSPMTGEESPCREC